MPASPPDVTENTVEQTFPDPVEEDSADSSLAETPATDFAADVSTPSDPVTSPQSEKPAVKPGILPENKPTGSTTTETPKRKPIAAPKSEKPATTENQPSKTLGETESTKEKKSERIPETTTDVPLPEDEESTKTTDEEKPAEDPEETSEEIKETESTPEETKPENPTTEESKPKPSDGEPTSPTEPTATPSSDTEKPEETPEEEIKTTDPAPEETKQEEPAANDDDSKTDAPLTDDKNEPAEENKSDQESTSSTEPTAAPSSDEEKNQADETDGGGLLDKILDVLGLSDEDAPAEDTPVEETKQDPETTTDSTLPEDEESTKTTDEEKPDEDSKPTDDATEPTATPSSDTEKPEETPEEEIKTTDPAPEETKQEEPTANDDDSKTNAPPTATPSSDEEKPVEETEQPPETKPDGPLPEDEDSKPTEDAKPTNEEKPSEESEEIAEEIKETESTPEETKPEVPATEESKPESSTENPPEVILPAPSEEEELSDPTADLSALEIEAITSKVSGFAVVDLAASGDYTLTNSQSLTVDDLRGIVVDENPPAKTFEPVYSATRGDGLPENIEPYRAREILPFRFHHFTNEFSYVGNYNWEMTDYAARHGFNAVDYRERNTNDVPVAGHQRTRWGGYNWNNWLSTEGLGDKRYDQVPTRAELVQDLLSKNIFPYVTDHDYFTVDLESPTAPLHINTLRTQSWYPGTTANPDLEFENRYYNGFLNLELASVETAKTQGWPSVGIYGWAPFPRQYFGLETVVVDPNTDWAWNRYGKFIYNSPLLDVIYTSTYNFYWNEKNVAYTLANTDFNLQMIADERVQKPLRPYFWNQLHGGGDLYRWWKFLPMSNEDFAAQVAMNFFTGADGMVFWSYSGVENHHTVTLAEGKDYSVGAPVKILAVITPPGTTPATTLQRYQAIHVLDIDTTNNQTYFQLVQPSLARPYGVDLGWQLSATATKAPTQPIYKIDSTTLKSRLRPVSEPVSAMVEGLALVRPFEYTLKNGAVKIDVPASKQFSMALPIIRRVTLGNYHIVTTYDPQWQKFPAGRSISLASFDGTPGLNLNFPADGKPRVFVLRANTESGETAPEPVPSNEEPTTPVDPAPNTKTTAPTPTIESNFPNTTPTPKPESNYALIGPTQTVGPFHLEGGYTTGQPQITFYLYSPGGDKGARVQVTRSRTNYDSRLLITHRGPDEALKFQKYVDSEYPEDYPPENGMTLINKTFQLSEQGVHEIRVNLGHFTYNDVALEVSDGVTWGYSVQNGKFNKLAFLPSTLYAAVPVHRQSNLRLNLRDVTGTVTIRDLTTNTDLSTDRYIVAPHATRNQHIWKFTLGNNWSFRANGLPLIFTTSEQAANLIGHSAERLSNGGLVAHKFQQQIFELLPHLLAHTGDREQLRALSDNYFANTPACSSPSDADDVIKNSFYTHARGPVYKTRFVLDANLNTRLPVQNTLVNNWRGSIGTGVLLRQKCEINEDCTGGGACSLDTATNQKLCPAFNLNTDRWDVLRSVEYHTEPINSFPSMNNAYALDAGPSIHYGGTASDLVVVATEPHVCNPYFGRNELFYRGVAAGLLDMLSIEEADWITGVEDRNSYPPELYFVLVTKLLPTYFHASPYLNTIMTQTVNNRPLGELVFEFWTEGLKRLVDRGIPEKIDSSHNKSAHQVLALEYFYQGSGLKEYGLLSRHFAKRFADSAHPSGFFAENTGIDATYQGLTNVNIAHYYRLSEEIPARAQADVLSEPSLTEPDPVILEAIRRNYEFFNHTVALELDGIAIGGFNFAERTGGGFFEEQGRGAHFIIEELPEVAAWVRPMIKWGPLSTFQNTLTSNKNSLMNWTNTLTYLAKVGTHMDPERWRFYAPERRPANAIFPAESPSNFITDLGGEIVAVKQDGYYASLYVGHPSAPGYIYEHDDSDGTGLNDYVETLQAPLSEATYLDSNRWLTSVYNRTPFLGGGLTGLWTEDLGHTVLSTNRSPYMQHGLVLQDNDKLYWAKYHSGEYQLHDNVLTFNGYIIFPLIGDSAKRINFTRIYTFLPHEIQVHIELESTGNFTVEDLFENIPVPVCNRANCAALTDLDPDPAKVLNTVSAKSNGTQILNSAGQVLSNGFKTLNQFKVGDRTGNTVTFQFSGTKSVNVARDGLRYLFWGPDQQRDLEIGRVEVKLPTTWTAGVPRTLDYSIEMP